MLYLEDLHCSFLQALVSSYLLYLSECVGDDRGDVEGVSFILLYVTHAQNLSRALNASSIINI